MVDQLPDPGVTPDAPLPPEQTSEAASARQGLLASNTSKIVVGAVAFLVVAAAVGAAVYFFLFNSGSDDTLAPPAKTAGTAQPSTSATGTAVAAPIIEPPAVGLGEVYTFRDIFDPLIKASVETTDTSSTSTTTTSTAVNTLFLQDIVVEDGQSVGVFLYNGTTYRVGEGDRIGTTPWQVVSLGDDSAVMLYGDTQITISVGQGVTK